MLFCLGLCLLPHKNGNRRMEKRLNDGFQLSMAQDGGKYYSQFAEGSVRMQRPMPLGAGWGSQMVTVCVRASWLRGFKTQPGSVLIDRM